MATRLQTSIQSLENREKQLRESDSNYRTLLENLPQKIFLKDINSTYISCNENYAKDLQIGPDEIEGKTDFDFYPEELAKKYQADDKRIIESGAIEELEERYIQAGMEFVVKTIKIPVRGEAGTINGIMGIFWDVSEEKRAENEKAELEAQLRQMQKMEAISQLTSGIAHDFNNMLTAIIGNGYILQMKMGKDSALMTFVDDILSTSERAAHLTRRLLTFSRKQIIDIKPVVLHDVINNVERLLLQVIGADIDLKINLSWEDITVMTDIGQMEQVFMNLAANARDAMPEGGLLSICTRVIDLDDQFVKVHSYGLPGKYALITVSDTGTGMDETVQRRIFEPFFTTKEIGKGTGLGLSIVYGIIKQLNGYLNVYSEPGKGTTFKIYLPIVESAVEETGFKEPLPIPAGGTETILLSEDETEVRKLTKTILEDFGYNVIETCDGEEAITRFKEYKNKINLLILDVVMPNKNGKEAYNEAIKLRPDIKTIFTSGYNEEIIHKKGVLEDGINFILKPFVPTELLRKVREVLDTPA